MSTKGDVAASLWRRASDNMRCANEAARRRRPRWWIAQEAKNAKSRLDEFFRYVESMMITQPDTPGDIKRKG